MLMKTIASVFAVAVMASHAYADTCPEATNIYQTDKGFAAKDNSGRVWEGENPMIQTIEKSTFVFESAAYVTEDENEDGPVKVSQLSCRYQKLALVLDNVVNWEATSKAWNKSDYCSKSIDDCSFSLSN